MVIAHNLMAINAQRQYNIVGNTKAKSTEKLASGYRINRSADDAAGLAISEKMRRQIRGLAQGANNIQDGISMIQVADGALDEVHGMLKRMTELTIQSANGTLNDEDRSYIQSEVNALVDEINRIGSTTTFNEIPLFDGKEVDLNEVGNGTITTLIASPSAEKNYLSEAYYNSKDGKYYPMGTLDFSNINSSNLDYLHNGSFSFNCSQSCGEVFDIKFTTDGSANSCSNLSGKVHHYYSVDLKGCTSGSEIVDRIYSYINSHLPTTAGTSKFGGIGVSHSNELVKSGNKLLVVANTDGKNTESEAKTKYPISGNANSGKIACTALTIQTPDALMKKFNIQCSSEVSDSEEIKIYKMNAEVLTIDPLDVSTPDAAKSAINKVKVAEEKLSYQRSSLGATQNRLEHSYNINLNVGENTTAAESAIRDTDMAKEMMKLSQTNILSSAGEAMMAQANQSNQIVLSLLQ